VKTKCHLFVYRLSHSGAAVHRVYPTCGQEAFLQGHIEAFEALGGVPTGHIRYDNLTSAVSQVLYGSGRRRSENPRWVLFRSHYGFDAFYCHPGIEGAHEKGGVEGEVGRFRRTWLTPMPEVKTLDELNEKIPAGRPATCTAASRAACTPSGTTSPPSSRCWLRCRRTGSTPASS
jgi:transposase